MNADQLEGKWKQLKGSVKEKCGTAFAKKKPKGRPTCGRQLPKSKRRKASRRNPNCRAQVPEAERGGGKSGDGLESRH